MPISNINNLDSGLVARSIINSIISVVNALSTTYEPKAAQSSIAASAIDWTYSHFYKTLSANTTFTFSNAADAKTIIIAITNTASNYTVTWPAGVKWMGGTEPTQTIGSKTDVYTLVQINSIIYGSYIQDLS